ncbi:MAG TPA: thioredoxin-disulfide reductase [Candidatus Ruthenibacterium avium]|uniref:Thioredoxin reductase n=1 Tax=Candidatus Ruthenibacterium avium TaxID=2838751 RepID=A0A9D2M200_9FIRM|nr:thioredoxin-disulfide reductase [Candidatus Ruthenibacterium avium]
MEILDTVIIGGGPAGYSAALYCTRAGLSTVIVEKMTPGGQMATTTQIDNYPGFEEGIDGFELGDKMRKGAERFGAKTHYAEVTGVSLEENPKKIATTNGDLYAKTVVIATGAAPRELGIADEQRFRGKGVGYCATCDGMFFRGKTVAVNGGGNTAVEDALFLSKLCEKVYLIHRRDTLRASRAEAQALEKAPNVEFLWNKVVTGLEGADKLEKIVLQDTVTKDTTTLDAQGLFVAIGRVPSTELFKDVLKTDAFGYIEADETTRTSIPGVFAVGDVRTKPLRQVVTAVGDGAVASKYIEEYITMEESK